MPRDDYTLKMFVVFLVHSIMNVKMIWVLKSIDRILIMPIRLSNEMKIIKVVLIVASVN